MATTYRICPRSGLQFDTAAEKLMRWHAVAGVLALLVGGIMALGVVLTRWPDVKLLPADTFYMVLTAHGIDMLIFWIIFFEMAVLIFASSTLLRCRLATPKLAWVSFWLMALGAIMTNVAIFQGESSVMFTSYVPMMAKPHFYLGLILFAVGALILVVVLLWTPFGFAGPMGGISATSVAVAACLGLLYVVSLVDANMSARAPRRRGSGWDV